ncbi:MAG: Bax inhibitor-1/YccA family protein [Planctomycetes bacterium]|nr:Bax inhibitor-1/YccA family protein [Planctomycetota bacterium]
MVKVYGWMTAAMMITAVAALFTAINPAMKELIYGTPGVWIGLAIATVVMVFVLSAAINKISAVSATVLFVLYSVLSGVTLGWVFLVYTQGVICQAFFVCAAMFGAMSLWGYTTNRDLSGWGSFLFMALVGLIIASVVNLFLASSALYWLVTYAGVFIFVGLTAYDTQKIKEMSLAVSSSGELMQKAAIVGALALYLDFINLFLMLLRLFGSRD